MCITTRSLFFIAAILTFGGCATFHQTAATGESESATDQIVYISECPTDAATGNMILDGDSGGVAVVPTDDTLASGEIQRATAESAALEKSAQSLLDEALEYYQTSQVCFQKGEPDNALEALDQSYALILEVDSEDDAKLIQQKDDLRILISKRVQEIYASRYTVATGNHNEIPMDLNEHVLKEIKSFQTSEKTFFLQSYKRSGLYHDRIVKALEEKGMPVELSWLPLIESGFKVQALSSARALGLWQFIPSTGYKFGLKRDTYVDERLDPEKATEAAIAYLSELHQIFGDWMTVLAAYNCGEGRVLRVIRGQNVSYLDNFWDLYQRLPLETARYVPRFLAAVHILNDPEKYGMELPEREAPQEYEQIQVNRQVTLAGISKALDVSETDLKALNPELRYNMLPADPYTLKVPVGRSEQLLASIDTIAISQLAQTSYIRHRVRSGETLSTIAKRYSTSVTKIMQANNLKKSNYIVAGKTLKIPTRATTITTTSGTTAVASADAPEVHTVQRGDSLWILAKKYGTTVKNIQALNGLSTTNLSIGQKLKIREATSEGGGTLNTIDTSSLRAYVVQKGDSPFTIAKRNNTSLNRLLQLNQLSTQSTIYPGQTLYID